MDEDIEGRVVCTGDSGNKFPVVLYRRIGKLIAQRVQGAGIKKRGKRLANAGFRIDTQKLTAIRRDCSDIGGVFCTSNQTTKGLDRAWNMDRFAVARVQRLLFYRFHMSSSITLASAVPSGSATVSPSDLAKIQTR